MRKGYPHFSVLLYVLAFIVFSGTTRSQSSLSVHGFLTQAYAISSRLPIFGIDSHGTFDYRILALQFRYDINANNVVVIQFNHRRIGKSPLMQVESDVSLDWAFYEYIFNENTSFQIGKLLLPFGIYNQIRDVGVLLPLYRAPFSVYGEENYMGETVDGAMITHRFPFPLGGELEINLYGGRWGWTEWYVTDNPLTGEDLLLIGKAQIERGGGIQTWIGPFRNVLKIGYGFHGGHVSGGLSFAENAAFGLGEQNFSAHAFSFDYQTDRFFSRVELIRYLLHKTRLVAFAHYAQVGVNLSPHIQGIFQADFFRIYHLPVPPPEQDSPDDTEVNLDYYTDYALGLKYSFTANIILKGEYHWNHGFLYDDGSGGLYENDPAKSNYFILSLATSF
ncbi:MAG: hypothetical protein D6748_15065 [Calditrichaeota bacterium]|nr:MAG: hypothetical protein D6748_15065 [Calditrichota bacterium]